MKRVFDFSLIDWIIKGLDQNSFGKVGSFLPDNFDRYIKILMPICIDKGIPIEDYSFKSKSIEELNKRSKFWDKYGIVNAQPAKKRLERISYKELANQLNIPYNKDIDTQTIWNIDKEWRPNLGSLVEEDIKALEEIINLIGAEIPTYFFGDVLDGKGLHENEDIVDWLFYGNLSEITSIYVERNQDFPSYFFAESKEWCFFHPEDEGYLLLGCEGAVAQKFLKSQFLECFEFDRKEQLLK